VALFSRYTDDPMTNKTQKTGLRERKKAEGRANVLEISHQLFREFGFDETTLRDICDEADISKRTFFRYFKDKESLIFPHREERIEAFVAFLMLNEQIDDPFDALRTATRAFGVQYGDNSDHLHAQQQIIQVSPALLGREREIDADWQRAIANAFSARAGGTLGEDLWAQVLAGAIMGVVRAIMNNWFAGGCKADLAELGLEALDYLEQGFPNVARKLT
jgi:AcrR family transcriptional regulator